MHINSSTITLSFQMCSAVILTSGKKSINARGPSVTYAFKKEKEDIIVNCMVFKLCIHIKLE